MPPRFIVVSGGVLSGLGKGIVSASIGRLLSSQFKVVPIKCDGYLNVDPGTMNPVEHGEVFVLDDGGEVDLDFGHYERFLNIDCKFGWNITSGKIFQSLVEKERRGDFLGKTVQVIPHVTGEIRSRIREIAKAEKADIVLIEIGGTVGDIENMWFLEAVREMQGEVGRQNMLFVHVGLVPVMDDQGQQKTKPMQQSLMFLRERGIFPQVIIGRSKSPLTKKTKEKLAFLGGIPVENVISNPNLETVYELPQVFEREGLASVISKELGIKVKSGLAQWSSLVKNIKSSSKAVTIALCGKYTELADSYISIEEALLHAGAHLGCDVQLKWIETTAIEEGVVSVQEAFEDVGGVIVPGGFGGRGVEGKIKVVRFARENGVPFLGLCYGMQIAVIEYARDVCDISDAHTTEVDPACTPVIDILPEQRTVYSKGGTMRLGGHDVEVKKGTRAFQLFHGPKTRQRFRHRYEVNPVYIPRLEAKGLVFSGKAPSQPIMQILESPSHPFFMASQFHPELNSRLERPSEMFLGFVKAAMSCKPHPPSVKPAAAFSHPVDASFL